MRQSQNKTNPDGTSNFMFYQNKKKFKKGMPLAIMIAVGKPRAMPTRGGRTATNMMKKSSRGK